MKNYLPGILASLLLTATAFAALQAGDDAPIFEAASYGIIGDAQKVLPDLISAVREMKQS